MILSSFTFLHHLTTTMVFSNRVFPIAISLLIIVNFEVERYFIIHCRFDMLSSMKDVVQRRNIAFSESAVVDTIPKLKLGGNKK